ncbi:hypothetical protein [Methylosinus sp. R-45379]|uniref:hypothetical protein n=1 Tax=Methylosinus sp. R-45379 TaxID=980563 RepID=UPI0012ECFAA5|nr:hypothetical protein [Methylosinus sp. R-45379]
MTAAVKFTQRNHYRTDWTYEAELLRIAVARGWVLLGGVRLLGSNRDRAIKALRKEQEAAEQSLEQLPQRRRQMA